MTPVRERTVTDTIRCLPMRTPTLPPATHTNAYLVGTREAVLVEPASPYEDEIANTVAWVAAAARRGIELRALVLTHHHPDHAGGAAALRERLGLPLWAHPATAERLSGAVEVDRMLEHGERIELDGPVPTVLEAVHTPGHAPGHLCFFDAWSRALIAGDMVASVGTILVEPVDGDMAQYLASLAYMRSLNASALLPAHGDPIVDAAGKLDEYIAHRQMREAKVLAALEACSRSASPIELVPVAYDDAPPAVWPLAERALEAHLIKLERDGRVARRADRWLVVPGTRA